MEGVTLTPRAGLVLIRPAAPGETIRGVVKPQIVHDRERPTHGVIVASAVEEYVPGQIIGWDSWAGSTFEVNGERMMMLGKHEIRYSLSGEWHAPD